MFWGQFAEDGNIARYNPHLFNLGEYNRLSPVNNAKVFFQSGSVIVFTILEIILLSTKQTFMILNVLH